MRVRGLQPRFYPTPLASTLLSDAVSSNGNLVIETNFRLYAYSSSRVWAEVRRGARGAALAPLRSRTRL